jgi:hypothetical protein
MKIHVATPLIKRSVMFAILRYYGIPYNNSKSAVLVEDMVSEDFDVKTGVL